MKTLLALICGATLFAAYAQAQDSSPATAKSGTSDTTSTPMTTTSGTSATTTTSTPGDSSGTVTDYTAGAMITLDPGTGQPVRFIIGKTVQVVTPDGKVIEAGKVKKNARVHVHLIADGDRTVVDKITVDDATAQ
jgi:hypothetical protein